MKYEKSSTILLGILYLAAGFMILRWPELLYFGVAAIFFIHGALILIKLLIK
ncbi:MAG: hypothetical protein ACMXX9_02270 [Candidatus Woesearchaeota archaeon]